MEAGAAAIGGIAAVSIDSKDPSALAAFWQRLLGGEITRHAHGHAQLDGPAVRLDFLLVPDPTPGKNRLHLDLSSRDYDSAIEVALAAGATRADDVYDGAGWQVLRDPEGNEFCILRPG